MLLKKRLIKYELILLWITLTSTAPFIFYSWPGHPYKKLTFICLSLMMVQIILSFNKKVYNIPLIILILIQILYYLFATLYHKDVTLLNLCIQLISLLIIITYIRSFISFELYVKSYIYIILAMGIGGMLSFFLHFIVGISPLFTVDYSASGTSYFLGLTTTNVYYNIAGIRIIRFSGFFDEPGTFGMYSIFAILLNKAFFNNKKIEIYLIIVSLFTFSVAFIITIFIYFLFFYINRNNVKYLFIFAVLITSVYFLLNKNIDNPTIKQLYTMSFARFMENEEGVMTGNNRIDRMEEDKAVFQSSPILGVGSVKDEVRGANIYSILAKYGIIGSIFYYIFIIYLLILIINLKKSSRLFYLKIFFIILLGFYHRPELSSVFSLLIFISLIHHIKNDKLLINNKSIVTYKKQT